MSNNLVDPADLVAVREIAVKLIDMGIYGEGKVDNARSQVTTWISRRTDRKGESGRVLRTGNRFPEPVAQLSVAALYYWPDVKKWIEDYYDLNRS